MSRVCLYVLALRSNLSIVLLKNLTAASISSSILRETFKVNLWLMRCLKSTKFVCLLLKLGCFSWFSACDVSVIKTETDRRIGQNMVLLQRSLGEYPL
jgi:hypothetical protein